MNEYHRGFLAEAERLGIEERSLTQGRKAFKFTGSIAGKRIIYFLCVTPSDSRRGLKQAIADLRRFVREAMGPSHHTQSHAGTKHAGRDVRRRATRSVALSLKLIASPGSPTRLSIDPWAALAALRGVSAARRIAAHYRNLRQQQEAIR